MTTSERAAWTLHAALEVERVVRLSVSAQELAAMAKILQTTPLGMPERPPIYRDECHGFGCSCCRPPLGS